jgi:hypothetical protein
MARCAELDRARSLQAEIRSLDREIDGLEKELTMLDNQKRRRNY